MAKAQFFFTEFKNSFSVYVKNLEELTVEQVKRIENFVSARRGVFDFNTYSFAIQKRLSFKEFVALIESSSIEATCIETLLETKSIPRVEFGQYKGMYYSELPDSYLLWLKSNYRGKDRATLENELNIRGL